jgi:hypothetical protein
MMENNKIAVVGGVIASIATMSALSTRGFARAMTFKSH